MIAYSIIKKSELDAGCRLDSEYYQPEYLELEKKVYATNKCKRWEDLEGSFITGPFGSEFNVENYVLEPIYRYIRGKDVKEFFLNDDDNVYIPQKDFERLKKYSLQEGDILISVVGTIGNSSIIDKSTIPSIFSCKSTSFRSNSFNPYYFIAYLNSFYGQKLLKRKIRGAVQTGLNIDDIKTLPVFIPSDQKQKDIASIVIKAKTEFETAKNCYFRSQESLLQELGLKDFKNGSDLSYIVNLSDIKKSHRSDAEFFQPKYDHLISKLKKHNPCSLGELVSLKKGIEPGSEAYQDQGKAFLRVSNLSINGFLDRDQKYLSDELYQLLKKDYEPKNGEILLTKDATPGITYVIKDPLEGIISGGILRLKLKSNIDPEYLALCINSIIGNWQAERDAGGSIISHWKTDQIKKLQIPILSKSAQNELQNLSSNLTKPEKDQRNY